MEENDNQLVPEDSIIYEVHCWAAREAGRKPNLDDGEFDHPERGNVTGLVCFDAESRAGQCVEYSCPVFEGILFSPDPGAVTSFFEFAIDEDEYGEEEEGNGMYNSTPPIMNPGVRSPSDFGRGGEPSSPPPDGVHAKSNPGVVRPVEAMGNAAKAALAEAGSQIVTDVVKESLQGAMEMGKEAVKNVGKTLFTPPGKDTDK